MADRNIISAIDNVNGDNADIFEPAGSVIGALLIGSISGFFSSIVLGLTADVNLLICLSTYVFVSTVIFLFVSCVPYFKWLASKKPHVG